MTGPQRYDRLVVPFIRPFTRELVRRAGELDGCDVLDHGAGTGEVTLALHGRWPTAHIMALDPNGEMLDRLLTKAGAATSWLTVRRGTIDVECSVGEFDLCASQMALMFVSDPARELERLRRAARDSGRLVLVVLASAESMVPFHIFWSACQEVVQWAVAASAYPHHCFADGERLRQLALAAGWRGVEVDLVTAVRVLGPRTLWHWLSTTLPIRLSRGSQTGARDLPARTRRELREAMLRAAQPYRRGERYHLPTAAWLLTALAG